MGNNKIIGAKIKNIRESKQLSIEEVAERSGLGIEQIERIEGNLDFPSLAPLIKIARVKTLYNFSYFSFARFRRPSVLVKISACCSHSCIVKFIFFSF